MICGTSIARWGFETTYNNIYNWGPHKKWSIRSPAKWKQPNIWTLGTVPMVILPCHFGIDYELSSWVNIYNSSIYTYTYTYIYMYWVYSISACRHSCNIISTCSVGNIAINHGDLFHKVQDRGGRSGMSGFGSWSQAIGKPAVKSVGFLSPWKTGWWCNNHLEKYEFVSWDDYSTYM